MGEIQTALQHAHDADLAVARARQQTTDAVAARAQAVQAAHNAGATWATIGARLGVSAQRAQQMARQHPSHE